MANAGRMRDLLAADVAVEWGVSSPARAAEALRGNAAWGERVDAEVERLLAEAGGDARKALARRGIDRSLLRLLDPEIARTIAEAGVAPRAPLRLLDRERYVEFAPLGEGGMGVVYLALDTELNRRIAFKMIRPSSGSSDPMEETPRETSEELRSRFLQEAWVTGGLEHPGIVPVYELGRTPSGVPYYTMRLVRGERTLDDAIAEATTLERRLALLEPFLKTCDAVRYAHSRGVVHRDLKPANVALGEFGEVVVLDWGLAKVKERPDLAEERWHARLLELKRDVDLRTVANAIGTPGYMSPEAAMARVDELDERSDVYSLGAILHRILTGRLPHDFASYAELVEKLSGAGPAMPDAGVPDGLRRICLKALATEREERFADAEEFAGAIRRWQTESAAEREVTALAEEAAGALEGARALSGEPLLGQLDRVGALCARIEALRPGDTRAAGLLDEAHRLREASIAARERTARKRLLKRVAVVGLAAATAATVLVAFLLDGKRREAEAARQREAEERGRAEDLAGFMLVDLRRSLEPIGRLDLLRQVALKSKAYYESLPRASVTPDVLRSRGLSLDNVGSVLEGQGDLGGALASFRAHREIAAQLAAADPASGDRQHDLATSLERIGIVLHAMGDLDGAMRALRESESIRLRLVARDDSNALWQRGLSVCLDRIGDALKDQGDLPRAIATFREATTIRERFVAAEGASAEWRHLLSISRAKIGDALRETGDLDGARSNYEDAIAIRRGLAAEDPSHAGWRFDLAGCLERLGHVHEAQGDLERALATQRAALEVRDELASRDPSNVAWQGARAASLEHLGDLLKAQGDMEGAGSNYRASLEILRRLTVQDPSNTRWLRATALELGRIGAVLRLTGDAPGAVSCLAESVDIQTRLASREPSNAVWQHDVASGLLDLGDALQASGELAAAGSRFRESLEMAQRLVSGNPSSAVCQRTVALALGRIGEVRTEQGDLTGARESFREALTVARRGMATDPSNEAWQVDVAGLLAQVGDTLRECGDLDGALSHLEESVEIARRLAATDPTDVDRQQDLSAYLGRLADALLARGDPDAAMACLRESSGIVRTIVARDPSNPLWQRHLLVDLLNLGLHAADAPSALSSYREALAIARRLVARDPSSALWLSDLAGSLDRVGQGLSMVGDHATALAHLDESVTIARRLVAREPTNASFRRDLALRLINHGMVLDSSGSLDAAIERHGEGLRELRLLASEDPSNAAWKQLLCASLEALADALMRRPDLDGALARLAESLELRRDMASRDRSSAARQRDVAGTLSTLADVHVARGALADAVESMRQAVEAHQEAVRLDVSLEEEHARWVEASRRISLVAGRRTPETGQDFLELAYAEYARANFPASAGWFAKALGEAAIRADLERGNLYNGACAAALAGPEWRAKAFEWLAEDLKRRRDVLVAADTDSEGMAELKSAIEAHFEHARTKDPDLASLRGSAEFDALFPAK